MPSDAQITGIVIFQRVAVGQASAVNRIDGVADVGSIGFRVVRYTQGEQTAQA